jgi:Zn-dependent protease
MPTGRSAIRLFRLAGVDVFLHWSWFVVAVFEIGSRGERYSSIVWNVFEYFALFLIVLMHEYGHALACRQVGGIANQIVLWPLGGVAYVDPPQRPGALLWSITAGPLVNVTLLPVFLVVITISVAGHWAQLHPDVYNLSMAIFVINLGLLIFNLLPIYPLDGGQILRGLLWYPLGRARSLMAATVVGFAGVAGLAVYAIRRASTWLFILGIFIVLNCSGGFKHSIFLLRLSKLPRRPGFACPWCKASPLIGAYWVCSRCRQSFDAFLTVGVCPSCSDLDFMPRCVDCGRANKVSDWALPVWLTQHT